MSEPEVIRIGIVGFGSIARVHAGYLLAGEVPGAVLSAVSSIDEPGQAAARELGGEIAVFASAAEMYAAGACDAALICTPHKAHPACAMEAMQAGVAVLSEKPAGVEPASVAAMNDAADEAGVAFSMMYHWRTSGLYQTLKRLLDEDTLGAIKRIHWSVTNWYRTQAYYDASSWRATWEGEGGGATINQSAHQLDLWQWLFGLPTRLRAFCGFGKYHDIEVEDDVTAYMEYDSGTTATFIASTGEAPGESRLVIHGDLGKIVVEDDTITLWKNAISERAHNASDPTGFELPACEKTVVDYPEGTPAHALVTADFVTHLRTGSPLLVDGRDGLASMQLVNAMILSGWTDEWCSLPVDAETYNKHLAEHIANSAGKAETTATTLDMSKSFSY
ncbi:MAG: Gfo/Idh/MocA family oxidoreductase [Phycisphaerales bacterium]|jgi:predicted dehydrogenase|nr:Gfo/Idh/MocA family oxidoreductase [Phycisphaerales bacterium]MBT7170298.1 Gfo/Idh/MocA family oxidoreductase [Phycisphaerales bacterium]